MSSTSINQSSLADRLYGGSSGSSAPDSPAQASGATPVAHDTTNATEPHEDRPLAERFYESSPTLTPTPAEYSGAALSSGFDAIEFQARYEGDTEAVDALGKGRRDAAAFMAETGVSVNDAKSLTVALARYATDPVPSENLDAGAEAAACTLRTELGADYETTLAAARAGYRKAVQRLPWLADLVESGAGNDPAVIRQFAALERRMSKGAKR